MSKCYDIYRELCGCEYGDTDGGPELTYCALHRAAPDLLAACEAAYEILDRDNEEYSGPMAMPTPELEMLSAAIRKAKGE